MTQGHAKSSANNGQPTAAQVSSPASAVRGVGTIAQDNDCPECRRLKMRCDRAGGCSLIYIVRRIESDSALFELRTQESRRVLHGGHFDDPVGLIL